ncbi:diguanylate cyclase [Candidatus Magnetomoraceae bacterium gMMP-15]
MEKSMLDILWILISAALVFLMQPGFMCLESGLTRNKNNINVAIKNLADFVFSVLMFWIVGYGLMFGLSKNGIIGSSHFFLKMDSDHYVAAFFFFQAMFCGTATTIFSGAVAERMRFSSYLIIIFLMSTFIYPIFGHWVWNGNDTGFISGWLGLQGFVDFAGSTVVHSVGGWVALAAIIVIGPRCGRFSKSGTPVEINAGNLPLSVLGTLLLWFGWFGFNGGSTLAMNENVPLIIARTTMAGASGAMSCLLFGWILSKIPKVPYLINGSLGGLVAITANCHCVNAVDSIIIGGIAGIICILAEQLLIKLKIDDAVGAIPVHLCCGIWGTLTVALFGNPECLATGLSFTGQLAVQIKGIITAFLISFIIPYFILRIINRIFPLRVSYQDEKIGLNVSEHGARTDLLDLFEAMDRQTHSKDLSMRVPEEPFTEVGSIAKRYNSVMEALQKAVARTDAIVKNAKDAIITFSKDNFNIMSVNPMGVLMFGYENKAIINTSVSELFILDNDKGLYPGKYIEMQGKKSDGSTFPIEGIVTEAKLKTDSFYVGTFKNLTKRKQKEELIKKSEKKYRSFFENTGTASVVIEEDTIISLVNSKFEKLSGYSREEIENKMSLSDLFSDKEIPKLQKYHHLRRVDPQSAPSSYETEFLNKSGKIKPVYMNVSMIPGSQKSVGSIVDLTQLRKAEKAFQTQRAYFHQLFKNSPLAIVLIGVDGKIIDINKGFEKIFGYKIEEIKGQYNRHILVPDDMITETKTFNKVILNGKSIHKETYRKHKDGRLIPVSVLGYPIRINEKIEGIFYIYEDISERKSFEQQLYHQAFHDALTGTPNRILFMERLERAVERRKRRSNYSFAVLLIDLDRFKLVNDTLGHLAGDALLIEVSERFNSCIRSVDTAARLGGDEFAILLEEFKTNQEVIRISKRLKEASEKVFIIEDNEVHISSSIGIVMNTKRYDNAKDILRDADIAMYRAKELGKARFKVFNKKMHEMAVASLILENDLRSAINKNELRLYYQPIVSVGSQEIKGFEALVRWKHPLRGIISPDEFIPIAEETSLIIPLGQWVIAEACRQMKEWQEIIPGSENLTVSVNVSTKQFLQRDLLDFIIEVLDETAFDPKCLKIELTESTIMKDPKSAVEQFNRMKAIGLQILIDDFGTGYSSFSYLQKFPIDYLKIDRSFISGPGCEKENAEIVKTIVALARNLGLSVVAEGVESESQLNILKNINCNNAQGYLFSKPVDKYDAEKLIKKN